MPTAIIFDFDGVIADSEVRANMTLAESLTAIGLPTSYDECLRDYYGHNWQETQRRIEADPAACLAIEDSPTGAQAALAAGMTVVGFCGAGHIVDRGAHGAMLRAVGVHHIAQDFADIATI